MARPTRNKSSTQSIESIELGQVPTQASIQIQHDPQDEATTTNQGVQPTQTTIAEIHRMC